MADYTVEEFCELHNACDEGREWALDDCDTMQDVWNKAKPDWLIWVATRDGVLTDKELRLFACWCARQVWHLLTDERSKQAVEVAERFAIGEATEEELTVARDAAWAAVKTASLTAAWTATWTTARTAALTVVRDAVRAAVRAAERDAARDAATAAATVAATVAVRDAAWDVAWDVARDVARATATATATVVVRDAAWDVARAAAMTAAMAAVLDPECSVVIYDTRNAARDDQASCLRQNCKPCFAKTEGM